MERKCLGEGGDDLTTYIAVRLRMHHEQLRAVEDCGGLGAALEVATGFSVPEALCQSRNRIEDAISGTGGVVVGCG